MKLMKTEEAVGQVLCHDITQIIKDEKKGVLFSKGHIVKEEDIPLLLSVGKEHLFVWEKKEGITLSETERDVLRLSAQGYTMNLKDSTLPQLWRSSQPCHTQFYGCVWCNISR